MPQYNTNKVVYAGETLIDLTSDTVTPDTLANGVTAHGANGAAITGTLTASKMFSGYIQYVNAETKPGFQATVLPIKTGQLTLVGRNTATGALYVVYYDHSVGRFLIATTLYGGAPTAGQQIFLSYEIA